MDGMMASSLMSALPKVGRQHRQGGLHQLARVPLSGSSCAFPAQIGSNDDGHLLVLSAQAGGAHAPAPTLRDAAAMARLAAQGIVDFAAQTVELKWDPTL